MRRWGRWALAALVCLALCACGAEKPPFDPEATAEALVREPGVFSETLERLDTVIAVRQYRLAGYLSLAQAKYKQYDRGGRGDLAVVAYRSTGATAEEVAVMAFADEEQAGEYERWVPSYLDEQREANKDYRPQEMPKLDNALVQRRGRTVLVLVADDYEAARQVLE